MTSDELLKQYELKPTDKDLLVKHERQLWQARFSPCGRYLIACGYDATIQRWDFEADEPKLMTPLTGHNGWIQCMDFQIERKQLLSADSWGQIACWSYEAEAQAQIWKKPAAHDGWIRALAVSPDGDLFCTGGNGTVVRMWSTETGKLLKELPHPNRVFSLRFHPDGTSLVSGDLTGVIRHWDLKKQKVIRQFIAEKLHNDEAKTKGRIQQCGGARHLEFDSNGELLICAGQQNPGGGFASGTPCVLVYNWKSGKLIREMPMGGTQDGFTYDACFHPDKFVMATSSAFPGKGHVWFWHPDDEKAFFSSKRLPNGRSLSLHPDGMRVAHLTSQSRNGNGRKLKDGKYAGGSAVIRILKFPSAQPSKPSGEKATAK